MGAARATAFVAAMACFSPTMAVAAEAANLAQFVADGQALWRVPGIAVAFIDGDDVQFVSRGQTRRTGGVPVTANTAFAIASTTKAMVAAATAILVDRGQLSWDEPLTKHFPGLRFHNGYIDRNARVIDLYTHSLGIPATDVWAFMFDHPVDDWMELLPHIPSTAPYRERFQYQNAMYDLAGALIEEVTGEPWHAFVRRVLWTPLGMDRTYASLAEAKASGGPFVEPHHWVGGEVTPTPYRPLAEDQRSAAGSVWSTAADMARWARFLLRGGVTESGEALISPEQQERLFEPQVLIAAKDFYPTQRLTQPKWRSYGLGWFQQDYRGQRIDFHTGSLGGLSAIVGLNRDAKRAVVVLENLDHAELRHAIMWEFFDPSRDWNQEVKAVYDRIRDKRDEKRRLYETARIADTRPRWPLEAYAGTYRHPGMGSIDVFVERGELNLKAPLLAARLDHWHHDTFMAQVAPWAGQQPVRFELDDRGDVEAIVIPTYLWAQGIATRRARFARIRRPGDEPRTRTRPSRR